MGWDLENGQDSPPEAAAGFLMTGVGRLSFRLGGWPCKSENGGSRPIRVCVSRSGFTLEESTDEPVHKTSSSSLCAPAVVALYKQSRSEQFTAKGAKWQPGINIVMLMVP